jgi:hypothetical protein
MDHAPGTIEWPIGSDVGRLPRSNQASTGFPKEDAFHSVDATVARPLDPIIGIWLMAFPRIWVYEGTKDSSPFEE